MNFYDFIILFVIALLALHYSYPIAKKYFADKYIQFLLKARIDKAIDASISSSNSSMITDAEAVDIGLGARKSSFIDSEFVQKIINANKERFDNIKTLLIKAGDRDDDSFEKYILYNNIVFGLILSIVTNYLIKAQISTKLPLFVEILLSVLCGIFLAVYISDMNLKSRAKSRQEQIDMGVPDLIDLLVICTDSGLDLHRAIMRVSRELRNSNVELSEEFTITAVEMEMIPDSKQVFLNLENRTDSLQIKSLAKTLSQSIEYGTSLSAVLKDLSQESRQKRILLAEEKAARIPTLLTLPLMLFILPCLFIAMLGPIVADVMTSFSD